VSRGRAGPSAHRISIPTPLPVGRVNCWLLAGEPLTLIDAGPNHPDSLAALEAGLHEHGVRVEDVELLVLTHQHVDHVGNASAIVERSGCRVAAHEQLVGYARELRRRYELESAYQDAVMALHGTPLERRLRFWTAIADRAAYWNDSVEVDIALVEDDTLVAGGRTLRVSHRPGHSPTDTIFVDDELGVAYVADHLLPHVSSNPLAARPPRGSDDPRDRVSSVRAYLSSLERTARDDLAELRPGHGRVIDDHRALIALRRQGHLERMEQVATALGDGPMSARAIGDAIWPGIAITQTYLTLCEALGGLDLLEERGRVRQVETDGVVRYERVPARSTRAG